VSEEGTVMALAAAGGPTYEKKFSDLVNLQPDGRFSINRDFISYDTHGLNKPFKERFVDAFGPRRQRNESPSPIAIAISPSHCSRLSRRRSSTSSARYPNVIPHAIYA